MQPRFGLQLSDRSLTKTSWDGVAGITSFPRGNINAIEIPVIQKYNTEIMKVSNPFLDKKRIFIIVIVCIFFAGCFATTVTTASLYSQRVNYISTAGYGESCLNKACDMKLDLFCFNQTCQCDSSSFYWNEEKYRCQATPLDKRFHGNTCKVGFTKCLNGTQCTNSICQCNTNYYYWSGLMCVLKKSYQESCSTRATIVKSPSNDPVNCVSDVECSACMTKNLLSCVESFCSCPDSTYYYDAGLGKCMQLKSYFSYCTTDSECDFTVGLYCQNMVGNTTSSCPSLSELNRCDCPYGQYYDYKLSKCITKKGYTRPCTGSCECDSDRNLQCYSNICACPPNTYYNNGKCVSAKTNGFLSSCGLTAQCNTDLGLVCTNISVCDCINPTRYYWSTTMQTCIECPDGWVILKYGNFSKCYLFSPLVVRQSVAAQYCSDQDATLLYISDINEYNTIFNYTNSLVAMWYWIGISSTTISSLYTNYVFTWANNATIGTYTAFGLGYVPSWTIRNDGSNFFYMTIYAGGGNFYLQNNYDPQAYPFICKKKNS